MKYQAFLNGPAIMAAILALSTNMWAAPARSKPAGTAGMRPAKAAGAPARPAKSASKPGRTVRAKPALAASAVVSAGADSIRAAVRAALAPKPDSAAAKDTAAKVSTAALPDSGGALNYVDFLDGKSAPEPKASAPTAAASKPAPAPAAAAAAKPAPASKAAAAPNPAPAAAPATSAAGETAPSAREAAAPSLPEAAPVLASSQGRIGFAGFFQGRLRAHEFDKHPDWLAPDAAGNRLGARLGLQVSGVANAHVAGRASLTFNDDLSGRFLNGRAGRSPRRVFIPGFGEGPDTATSDSHQHPDGRGPEGGNGVFEDLMGEVELRSPMLDARLAAGTTLWVEGSPLTMWNRDSRPDRGWYYEDFEPEMSSAAYHAWKVHSRSRDLGRHAWNKRPLGGLAFETVRMPLGLSLKAALADPAAVLPTEVAGRDPLSEGPSGLLDGSSLGSRGALWHVRAGQASGSRSFGLSLLAAGLPEDLINQRDFSTSPPRGFVYQFRKGEAPAFTNPRVASAEYAGPLGSLDIHGEMALSMDDTVRYLPVTEFDSVFDGRSGTQHLRGPPAPAAWLKVATRGPTAFETELFFASPDFRSPWSMVQSGLPVRREGMAPAAGAAQYRDNLIGVDVRLAPSFSSGFLVFRAGQHVQVEPGPDVIRFEHVLNGRELWDASTSSTRSDAARQFEQGHTPGNPRYDARLGQTGGGLPRYGAQQPGGLRGGDREVWEEFAVFTDKAQADSGIAPKTRKWSSSLSLDWGIPLDGRLGLDHPALVNLFGEIGAVGANPTALAGPARAMLWTARLSMEPAFSVTDDFHLLGMAGVETWRGRNAWRNTLANKFSDKAGDKFDNRVLYEPLSFLSDSSQGTLQRIDAAASPIDYLQWGVGMGFDWDVAPRTGLHFRMKHARHRDASLPSNDWSGTFLFLELKSWI